MPTYAISDAVLRSTVSIPELPLSLQSTPDITVELLSEPLDLDHVVWFQHWPGANGQTWASFGRLSGGYVVRFPELADFAFDDRDGVQAVRCVRREGVSAATFRHLLLDQIVPLLLNRGERIALHASAVVTVAGVVAFGGAGGAGKSTLSALFLRFGDRLLTDDSLLVAWPDGRAAAYPSYPSLRLWPDAVRTVMPARQIARQPVADNSSKIRVALAEEAIAANTPVPLRTIYVVTSRAASEAPRIDAMSRRDGFRELLTHVFRLDPYHRAELIREMHLLSRLVMTVAVKRLAVPKSFDSLRGVRDLVMRDVTTN